MGKDPYYPVPEKIPGLTDRAGPVTTRRTCIHCHMVKEYTIRARWMEGKLTAADLFVYPMPDNLGMAMAPADGLVVASVKDGSAAGKAGIKQGDELVTANGQPLLSLADVQWVLHNLPDDTPLSLTLRRGGQTLEKQVVPGPGWRESDIGWRASSWYGLRQGLKLDPLPPEQKAERGIPADRMALSVTGMFGTSVQVLGKAGLRKGDVIVAADGKSEAMTETDFLVFLRLQHGPKDQLKLTVLRGRERKELTVPMW